MMMRLLFLFLHILIAATGVTSQVCTGNDWAGEDNPKDKDNDVEAAATGRYLVNCNYAVPCCGIVNQWAWYSEAAGSVDLMIWRRLSGTTYELVHTFSDTATSKDEWYLDVTNRVLLQPGDCIGWHSAGTVVLTYKEENSGTSVPYVTSIGATIDLSGAATTSTTRNHAIGVRVSQGANPTFATTPTTYTVSDGTATSTPVVTVTFADTDLYDSLSLAMTTSSTYFDFTDNNDNTGFISTSAVNALSDLSGTTVTLSFTATDSCGLQGTGSIDLTIQNQAPVLSGLPGSVDLREDNMAATLLYSLTCTDSPEVPVISVLNIDPSNAPNEFFYTSLIPGTSDYGVYVRGMYDTSLGVLDFDTSPTHNITIQCTDGKDPVTGVFTVNLIKNETPVMNNLAGNATVSALTTTGGDVIFTVDHTDAEGDTVAFTSVCTPTPCPFEILDSGAVQATMDLEAVTTPTFEMAITIYDERNVGSTLNLTINMIERKSEPALPGLPTTVSINENLPAGTTVTVINVTDPEPTDVHTIRMSSTVLEGSLYFQLDSTTGVITTKTSINYEALTDTVYPFTVTASDGRTETSATLTLQVNDVNEPLTWNSATYRTDVVEGLAVGSTIPDPGFAVTDPDVGDTLTCSLDCGTYDGYFEFETGCILKVNTTYRLDDGLPNTLTCTVTGTDSGGFTDTTTLIINIEDANNYTPEFSPTVYNYTITAYTVYNDTVGTPTAVDNDTGSFGVFSYSLVNPVNVDWFQVDAATGRIWARTSMLSCSCPGNSYVLYSVATDTGSLAGTATVYIDVLQTTTVIITTTTDRYITYFEDVGNLVLFSFIMATLLVTIAALVYMCIKHLVPMMREARRHRYRLRIRELERPPPREVYRRRPETPPPRPERRASHPRKKDYKGYDFWNTKDEF